MTDEELRALGSVAWRYGQLDAEIVMVLWMLIDAGRPGGASFGPFITPEVDFAKRLKMLQALSDARLSPDLHGRVEKAVANAYRANDSRVDLLHSLFMTMVFGGEEYAVKMRMRFNKKAKLHARIERPDAAKWSAAADRIAGVADEFRSLADAVRAELGLGKT